MKKQLQRCAFLLALGALVLGTGACGGGGGGGGASGVVQQTRVILMGYVLDAVSDAGIPNASVAVAPAARGRAERRTVTNAEGLYSFENMEPGSAKMTIALPDGSYQSIVLDIDIPGDRPTASITARLVPRDAEAPASVTLAPKDASVPVGGSVQFTAQVAPASGVKAFFSVQGDVGTISADGLFTATKVGSGQVVALAGSVMDATTVTVTPGAPSVGAVTGTVMDANGAPLAGATVSGGGKSATTGADGLYTLAGLPPGDVTLTASKSGYGTAAQTATVTAGNTTTVDWRLAIAPVGVRISPESVTVDQGSTQQFSVVVTGTADTGVGWSVQEGVAGGSITSSGLYTAPGVPGTYHVVAASYADPSKSATAVVTVQSASPVPGLAKSPWPKFHADAGNTGQGQGRGATGALKWAFPASYRIDSSPAIGADGTVYVGSPVGVHAIDGAIRTEKWAFTGDAVLSSPAIGADGTIYVGSNDRNVYALDGATGAKKWAFTTGGWVQSSPAIGADGTVYVGSHDKNVYALDGATGAQKWALTTDSGFSSCPAIGADGTVYVGLSFTLYALDGGTGAQKWAFTAGGYVTSSAAVGADGTVYVGAHSAYVGSGDGKVYALDGATGTQKWAFTTGVSVRSSPAISADGTIYVGSDDGKVYALDGATGTQKWAFTTGGAVQSSPAIGADGTVYVGSDDGNVYALDGATGAEKWAFPTGDRVRSSPAIGADGTIYVGSDDGKVYAIR